MIFGSVRHRTDVFVVVFVLIDVSRSVPPVGAVAGTVIVEWNMRHQNHRKHEKETTRKPQHTEHKTETAAKSH